jgi:hypothetical protein
VRPYYSINTDKIGIRNRPIPVFEAKAHFSGVDVARHPQSENRERDGLFSKTANLWNKKPANSRNMK